LIKQYIITDDSYFDNRVSLSVTIGYTWRNSSNCHEVSPQCRPYPSILCRPRRSQSAATGLANKSTVRRSREIDALDHQHAGAAGRVVVGGTKSRGGPTRISPVPEMAISDTPTDC